MSFESLKSGKRIVVIGGVAAGMSAASKARRLSYDIEILLFEKSGHISYGSKFFKEKRDIDVFLYHEVVAIYPAKQSVLVKNLQTGRPNSEIAKEAGIPGIYSAGDCAMAYHQVLKRQVYFPLGTTANKQGKVAGENTGGGNASFKGIVGTSVLKVFDLEVAKTGLSRIEAQREGFNFISNVLEQSSRELDIINKQIKEEKDRYHSRSLSWLLNATTTKFSVWRKKHQLMT